MLYNLFACHLVMESWGHVTTCVRSGLVCRGAKLLEGMLADLNAADPPKIGTRAVCGTWLALRSEIIAMLELKKKVMSKTDAGTPASSTDNRSKRGVKNKVSGPVHDSSAFKS